MPAVDCDRASEDVNTHDIDGNVLNETNDDSLVSSSDVADKQRNDVHIESIASEPVLCVIFLHQSVIQMLMMFLQRVSIACYAECYTSYSKSVRLSVPPSARLSDTCWH